MLHSAFITAYPSERAVERPRTQAARDAARAASGSSDSSDAESEANSDVLSDLSSPEELVEEEMTGPEFTPTPFKRQFPRFQITCAACKAGKVEFSKDHTRVPGECKYPPCPGCMHRRHMDHKDHTRKQG